MTDEKLSREEFHQSCAKNLFNAVWTMMEKPQRSVEDDDEMIHMAHASRYHWQRVGTAVNLARGEWQVSRVYSVLRRAEPALHHAQRCLEICESNTIGDFDLAFAHESLARAYAVAGNQAEATKHIKLAQTAAKDIKEEDDRELLMKDLSTIPTAAE